MTTGAAEKYQDLDIILAHAGGFVPYVASRIGMATTAISAGGLAGADVSDSAIELLKRFYVDTALSSEDPLPVSYCDGHLPHYGMHLLEDICLTRHSQHEFCVPPGSSTRPS